SMGPFPTTEISNMNIAIIGASGFIGSALLAEALARGHRVTALVSNPAKIPAAPGLPVAKADVLDSASPASPTPGKDAALSAFSGHAQKMSGSITCAASAPW